VSRLVDITEGAYRKTATDRSESDISAINIKNGILRAALPEDKDLSSHSEQEILNLRSLIEAVHDFKKNNRKHQRRVTMNKLKKQKQRQEREDEAINYFDLELDL
jgi:hypothetical protein